MSQPNEGILHSRYEPFLPAILDWIEQTLNAHEPQAQLVTRFRFQRLPNFFSESVLNAAQVVIIDKLPVPPLSAMGLREFASFETQPMSGITYQNTYFLERAAAIEESLHFHELVHVVQWQLLGPKEFLLRYASGLAEHGYAASPLEAMAYDLQTRFDAGELPYSVEAEVQSRLTK
jgi:hypothetical protein